MIQLQDFEAFLPVLRRIGNQRSAYNIFVDASKPDSIDCLSVGMNLPADKQILVHKDCADAMRAIAPKAVVFDDAELLDKLFDFDGQINIVFADVSMLFKAEQIKPLALVFNELHVNHNVNIHTALFNMVHNDNVQTAYVRALINDTDIVAVKVTKDARYVLQSEGFVQWEDWHTLLVSKSTRQAVQIIWDTREIVGYAVLTEQQFTSVVGVAYADDNSLPMFDRVYMPDNTKFTKFIIDTIIT